VDSQKGLLRLSLSNHKEYQGDAKEADEIWDTYEEMLKHFTKKGLS